MKTTPFFRIIVVLIPLIMLHSCQKEETQNNITAAREGSSASNLFDDIFRQVDYAARALDDLLLLQKSFSSLSLNGCPSLNIDPVDETFPKTLTLSYGPVNCIGADFRERRGTIQAVITDYYKNPNCTITVSVMDYHVNDYLVEGTKTIVNQGRNQANKLHFSVKVENGKITSPDNEITTWNSTRTNEWIEGESTPVNILDDVYLISGTASGKTSEGRLFTFTITTDLNIQVGCPWIRSGAIEISQDSGPSISVDYGDGNCDASAVALIRGIEIPFVML